MRLRRRTPTYAASPSPRRRRVSKVNDMSSARVSSEPASDVLGLDGPRLLPATAPAAIAPLRPLPPAIAPSVFSGSRPVSPFDGRGVRVSVVIPALNEEKNLPHVFARLPAGLHEVIVVDGHSTDRTVTVARA